MGKYPAKITKGQPAYGSPIWIGGGAYLEACYSSQGPQTVTTWYPAATNHLHPSGRTDSLGPDCQQLEGVPRRPLLVLELPEGCIAADAVRIQRQTRHKSDLKIWVTLSCVVKDSPLAPAEQTPTYSGAPAASRLLKQLLSSLLGAIWGHASPHGQWNAGRVHPNSYSPQLSQTSCIKPHIQELPSILPRSLLEAIRTDICSTE